MPSLAQLAAPAIKEQKTQQPVQPSASVAVSAPTNKPPAAASTSKSSFLSKVNSKKLEPVAESEPKQAKADSKTETTKKSLMSKVIPKKLQSKTESKQEVSNEVSNESVKKEPEASSSLSSSSKTFTQDAYVFIETTVDKETQTDVVAESVSAKEDNPVEITKENVEQNIECDMFYELGVDCIQNGPNESKLKTDLDRLIKENMKKLTPEIIAYDARRKDVIEQMKAEDANLEMNDKKNKSKNKKDAVKLNNKDLNELMDKFDMQMAELSNIYLEEKTDMIFEHKKEVDNLSDEIVDLKKKLNANKLNGIDIQVNDNEIQTDLNTKDVSEMEVKLKAYEQKETAAQLAPDELPIVLVENDTQVEIFTNDIDIQVEQMKSNAETQIEVSTVDSETQVEILTSDFETQTFHHLIDVETETNDLFENVEQNLSDDLIVEKDDGIEIQTDLKMNELNEMEFKLNKILRLQNESKESKEMETKIENKKFNGLDSETQTEMSLKELKKMEDQLESYKMIKKTTAVQTDINMVNLYILTNRQLERKPETETEILANTKLELKKVSLLEPESENKPDVEQKANPEPKPEHSLPVRKKAKIQTVEKLIQTDDLIEEPKKQANLEYDTIEGIDEILNLQYKMSNLNSNPNFLRLMRINEQKQAEIEQLKAKNAELVNITVELKNLVTKLYAKIYEKA